jgi:hypothetical protein
MSESEKVQRLIESLSPEARRQVFAALRKEITIHRLEQRLNTSAEVILEAFDRAGPFTFRMIRGVIAEASFAENVVGRLRDWQDVTPPGDHPFDFMLADEQGKIRVQVKLQRSESDTPLVTKPRRKDGLPEGMYLVETDKSRDGSDDVGESTRGYRFGSFDILAVSLWPSTNDWSKFRYTVERWLRPRAEGSDWMYKFQPVSMSANTDWTDDFNQAVEWFRSGWVKTIGTDPSTR